MAANVIKFGRNAPKAHSSTMETRILSVKEVNDWRVPPFQRPVRVNQKVLTIAEEIKCDGVSISGMLTLGKLTGDPAYYVVDGQHRLEAFRLSGLDEVIADVRIVHFDTMAEMADEFVHLNTAIVRMRPDDILRGLTPTMPPLQRLVKECPFIGYDNIRRRDASGPLVSLGSVLRCWHSSSFETPSASSHGNSINQIAQLVDDDNAGKLSRFLQMCLQSWGRDPEYFRMWGNLNLALNMWLYRRLVLDTDRRGAKRIIVMTDTQFRQCMTALSANSAYMDWLPGRLLNDRDRSPALRHIKATFQKRLADMNVNKVVLPQPAWASR